jgi:hypothetical protein
MPNCTSWTLATSAGEYGNLASISAPTGAAAAADRRRLGFQIAAAPQPARGTKPPGPGRRVEWSVFLAAGPLGPDGIERIGSPGRSTARSPPPRGRGKGNGRGVPLRKGRGEEGWGCIYRRGGRRADGRWRARGPGV